MLNTDEYEDKLMEAKDMMHEMKQRGKERDDSVFYDLQDIVSKAKFMEDFERKVLIDFAADHMKDVLMDYMEQRYGKDKNDYLYKYSAILEFLHWIKEKE